MNPTSPYRMELILQNVMKQKHETVAKTAKLTESGGPQKLDAESLVDELASLKLSSVPDVSCKCTRKCKTKKCECYKNNVACNRSCHPHNNSCENNPSV